MTKNLVIVESPAKAKTIEGFLGKDYLVKSCFGHVMDLSKKDLGVDIENGFIPQYIISPDKKKLVAELKKLAKDAEIVWLASDEDREGEAIAWHLMEALDLKEDRDPAELFFMKLQNRPSLKPSKIRGPSIRTLSMPSRQEGCSTGLSDLNFHRCCGKRSNLPFQPEGFNLLPCG